MHLLGGANPTARVIALVNQKGGCGKTTTAVNLAACVARSGRRVLLVDLDPQANATMGLGVDPASLSRALYHVLVEDASHGTGLELPDVIVPANVPNLDLVPASIGLAASEIELSGRIGRENVLRKKLAPALGRYDYIFVDTPPSLGLLTLNALVACDAVIIPIQTQYYAFLGVRQLLRTLAVVREEIGHEITIAGALPTMYDARTHVSKEIVEGIHQLFGGRVFKSVIHVDTKLVESSVAGVPACLHNPTARGAQEYTALASEVMARDDAGRAAPEAVGPLQGNGRAETLPGPARPPHVRKKRSALPPSPGAPPDAADGGPLAPVPERPPALLPAARTAATLRPPAGARARGTRIVGVVDFYAPIPPEAFEDRPPQRLAADALADLLARAAGERFVIVPRATIRRAAAGIGWREEDVLSTERLRALARAVGAHSLVAGWITGFSFQPGDRDTRDPRRDRREPAAQVSVVVRLFDEALGRIVAEVRPWTSTVGGPRPGLADRILHRALEPAVSPLVAALAA